MQSLKTLQAVFETDSPHFPYAAALTGGVAIVSGVVLYKKLVRKDPVIPKGPPDTAVIYQIKRGPNAPSMSPFPVKLETFCRLSKIPYVAAKNGPRGPKGKFPWMTYNGEVVSDSQICMDFLKKKLGVDPNKHLDNVNRGISRHIQILVDEHLYWIMVYYRWVHDKEWFPNVLTNYFGFPWFVVTMIRRTIRGQLHAQGIGRHSPEQVQKFLMDDLQALSDILGTKSFMLGELMCEADCSAFGLLSQFVWHQEDKVLGNILQDNFPNLHKYCLRVKEKLWSDWDECCKDK